jgi:hypothetical protein
MTLKSHWLTNPPPTVLKEARRLYREALAKKDYPEDLWWAVNPYWDINLFEDENGRHATLYPVVDENTLTDKPYPVTLLSL